MYFREDESIKLKVDKIFKLFQETKSDSNWSSFLSFREGYLSYNEDIINNSINKVMLATENLFQLGTFSGQLRWMFR